MASRRALVVINDQSRSGTEARSNVASALSAAGLSVDVGECSTSERLSDLISRCAESVDCIVVGGGDGTLNAAIPALLETKLPLGVIPLGTANDLARTLGIPTNFEQAIEIIASGHSRRVDVGEVNGHPFFNVASLGFGVDLTRALTKDSKSRWGKFGYVVAGLRVVGRIHPFHATIEVGDTVKQSRTIHLAVGNGRHYGGGMTVSEDAAIDDDRLDIYSLEVPNAWSLVKILPSLRSGRHGHWAEVKTMAGQSVTVRTRRPRSINADGEIVTQTPAHFHVLHQAVEVYSPIEPK